MSIDQNRRFPLVVASNRDEYFSRPAARLDWWSHRPGDPPILGGRDIESGGTWLGLSARGRFAFLTNLRGPMAVDADAPSRGTIVPDWLGAHEPADRFWMRTALAGHNGFNLIAADLHSGECFWASNAGAHPRRLERGVYGLSNAGLDAPWPKVQALKERMGAAMKLAGSVDELAVWLFDALADPAIAADAALPRTGIPLALERQLSAAFIRTSDLAYGTRCSTLIITERAAGRHVTHVLERSFEADGSVSALRRAVLQNWPSRAAAAMAEGSAEPAAVLDVSLSRS